MLFEALPARYGDCLFLTFPRPGDRPLRLLIDGGPAGVYVSSLKKRLDEEAKAFPAEKPLNLDAVMISHIDEDHILGVLDLFSAIQDADQRKAPRPYQPKWLLHNSFDGLLGEGEGSAARALDAPTVLAGLGGELAFADAKSLTARLVLQSYGQGSKLASIAAALRITRNPPDQRLLTLDAKAPRVLQLGDAKLTVVGPLQSGIDNLRKEWAKWKAKQQKKDSASLAALTASLDTSVPNLSSIVVLLEVNGKKLLLTGDALGDQVVTGLEEARIIEKGGVLDVDLLKLPHHASIRNVTPKLLKQVRAKHYVASGDGTYGNPDRATLELLEKIRPEGGYTVHLTYDAASCDATHEAWGRGRKGQEYVPAEHSIAEVVARWKDKGKIAVEEGPVKIQF
ncbi:hypothetical protein P6144_00880 [Sphingomonas sp. HITSZ_GF]|uniref:ComEC/Rec2 family competence protein n=1 Tax=Sphingomonas sp. HITSZ_GF TaxID=3037247 RepID=UPI00240DB18B|nr:hypothetical protein [Sphingomonas sp. HITSZ_GF]MDG2532189.1 hypothetical protein [Sphingomonas sp. HITSZ_GF]